MVLTLTVHVCEVKQVLGTVREAAQAENRVVLDTDVSSVEDKTAGQKTWLKDETGMHMLRV